ncbi:protein DEHYDRATION-INDUCED 19 homolog 4-like isoform X2 [Phoenix dactylifera]|uniref:Protein DEHYDRATION-INDUCED 19 homolog 4-like isoform X2 n=1 Tax=Phoenix dactylifera TaxID=42345 RepID=A0A8B7CZ53_PHODC|nr:protein DEHYDRATION-INDUCED 19 homolog 4-like isoform X2 [Phoenix dactylifera]
MDSDFWMSRIFTAKRHYSLQHHQNSQLDRFGLDDFEMERKVRPDFPCPYCYEDHDITSLCTHLEHEHLFESKVAPCPICSVKVSKDMLNHITLQHGHLFKLQRRRRLRKVAIPNTQALSLLGRDLREAHFQVLFGTRGYQSGSTNASTAATDSLLSSLVLNFPPTEVEETAKSSVPTAEDTCIEKVTPSQTWKSSFESSLSYEERERRRKHATFVQDLVLSTLFGD